MKATRIHLQWEAGFSAESYRAGVSLHSHTLHSRESLDLLYRAAQHSALLRAALRHAETRYRKFSGTDLKLERGWWTPPLAPLDAYNVECNQIRSLGLNPLVSLTDHDDIEAPMSLQAIDAARKVPISVEWTVPIHSTYLHVGIHNLPPARARAAAQHMQDFTAKPDLAALKEILAGFHANPGTLIVLNHPLWDEKGVGAEAHRKAVLELLGRCGEYIHAVELNGLRPWNENRQAILLGRTWFKPIVSGGDRHALEPNVTLNLTNAECFSGFAAEIRRGYSSVLITSRYRQEHRMRIAQNVLDVLGTYDDHGLGWREWPDRVFYKLDNGAVQSLAQIWGEHPPASIAAFSACLRLASRTPLRQAIRAVSSRAQVVAL
ncbi:MAG TPA: hypothetical protein VGJ09_07250 [Bryobacteraceae bacterium]